jgi:hypothetical protein
VSTDFPAVLRALESEALRSLQRVVPGRKPSQPDRC